MSEIKDGIIRVDSQLGQELGFTKDKFSPDSYLWKDGDRIIISLIFSIKEGEGYLSELFDTIESMGYRVAVPTPLARMQAILINKGFVWHDEEGELGESVEMWEKNY